MLRYKVWAIQEFPNARVYLSYYSGHDVTPYPSLWIEDDEGRGTKDLMPCTNQESIPSDALVQALVEEWAEK